MTLDPALQPIDWRTVEDALYTWVTGEVSLAAIWENQNIQQPAYPYIGLKRMTVIPRGGKPEIRYSTDLGEPAGEEIEILSTSQCDFTLTVQVRMDEAAGAGDPDNGSYKQASKLQASLGKQSVQAAFVAAGIAVIETLSVADLSEVVNGKFIDRAVFDVRLRVASVMTEQTGYIADVDLEYDPNL
jgi:hypothetical protein